MQCFQQQTSSHGIYNCEKFKKNNLAGTHFQKVKSNTRMNRKHSKTNRLLKTIECITND